MENDVLYNRIMNVVHEEYGEGSTAVANPEGEPTDDLTSIQIGDEIYGISGGGGGGSILIANTVYNDEEDRLELDKTYNEIATSLANKIPVYFFMSSSWEEEGVMYDAHQLYPVHYCSGNTGTGGGYRVFIIGLRGGNAEGSFYSSTRDGVLVFEND